MSKALSTQIISDIEQDIIDAEHEIDSAMITEGETWVTYALQLERIKKDFERAKKKSEKPFGLNSFSAYCDSRRARFEQQYCNRLALAMPDYKIAKVTPAGVEVNWTERALREVRKLKTTVARKSALKAAAEDHIKNETPLTTAVRNAVAEKKTFASELKAAKEFKEAVDPARNLKALLSYTNKHVDALNACPRSFWTAAEKASPGIATSVAAALTELAAIIERKSK